MNELKSFLITYSTDAGVVSKIIIKTTKNIKGKEKVLIDEIKVRMRLKTRKVKVHEVLNLTDIPEFEVSWRTDYIVNGRKVIKQGDLVESNKGEHFIVYLEEDKFYLRYLRDNNNTAFPFESKKIKSIILRNCNDKLLNEILRGKHRLSRYNKNIIKQLTEEQLELIKEFKKQKR